MTVSIRNTIEYDGAIPKVPDSVFIAPGSWIIGDVTMGAQCSVWYNVVVRGDVNSITIGERTNIQDGSVLHVRRETGPLAIGDEVTCGHAVNLHACTLQDRCLIGIGAIVLDGAVVESESLVAAGAVVPPGMVVPSGSLVAGVPARVRRQLTDAERTDIAASAERYVKYASVSRSSL